MKKLLLLIALILTTPSISQNMVPNGSFEEINIQCIYQHSAIKRGYVFNWYAQPILNTADVFNPCDTLNISTLDMGVPKNGAGFKRPRTKYNYAGIYTLPFDYSFNNNYYNEILSVKLSQQLDSGFSYSFSLKLSVANSSNLFLDGLGLSVSNDSIIQQGNGLSHNIIVDISQTGNGYLSDTLNWLFFSGTFTAESNDNFLHIADFDRIKTNNYVYNGIRPNDGWFKDYPGSYYYIDDVALWKTEDSIYISSDIGQADTTICYGDSLLLGSNDYDETYYRWEKITHGGQDIKSTAVFTNKVGWAEQQDYYTYFKREQIYDSGFVWVKPTKTTTYILESTNCIFEKTYDTVVVTVQKCGPNAGMDTAVCKNSTLVLGDSDNIGYSCQWYPNTFLSSDTAAMPIMTATQSMIYFLSISDASGVIKTDSIYVTAGECYTTVEVRNDTTICKSDTVHLGKYNYPGAQYQWTPNWLLDNNTIANPYCLADSTILYTLKLTDIVGNVSYDSVLVTVTICPGFEDIKARDNSLIVKVYPNPAKEHIKFEILDYSNKDTELKIFNSMGRIVYNGSFDGTVSKVNTAMFQNGIYFYRIIDSKKQSAVGKFVVL